MMRNRMCVFAGLSKSGYEDFIVRKNYIADASLKRFSFVYITIKLLYIYELKSISFNSCDSTHGTRNAINIIFRCALPCSFHTFKFLYVINIQFVLEVVILSFRVTGVELA